MHLFTLCLSQPLLRSPLENPGFWFLKVADFAGRVVRNERKKISTYLAFRLTLFLSLFYSSVDMQADTSKQGLAVNTPCFYRHCTGRHLKTQGITTNQSFKVIQIQTFIRN